MGIITTYLRSSSYNCWDFCPFLYFLDYGLGLRAPANKKAEKGTITHKALELLGRYKLAQQNGHQTFVDQEIGKEWSLSEFDKRLALDEAWAFYTQTKKTIFSYSGIDKVDCYDWMELGLTTAKGKYSPLNRDVIEPETFFDFTIEKPEFWYSYILPNGEKVEGYLALKGTVDLLVRVDGYPNMIELIDWKTGASRKDWAKGHIKEYEHLRKDPQLRIYHYALCHMFPEVEQITMTIIFMRAGGAYPLAFSREKDLPLTEKMLADRFQMIRQTGEPKRIKPDWRCESLCWYGKHYEPITDKTLCDYYHDELIELGIDQVIKNHGKTESIISYGEGGGTVRT